MKRAICMFLCAMLVLGVFSGCNGGAQEEQPADTAPVSAGFAKVDISPRESVSLEGYGDHDTRFSSGMLEPLYATAVAFSDIYGEKMVFIAHDLLGSPASVFAEARKKVSEATGLPVSRILFTASHSHSSPYLSGTTSGNVKYVSDIKEQFVDVAVAALADLSPVSAMRTGFTRVENANVVRHYLLSDGSYQGRNMGAVPKEDIIGHYSSPDNLLQVVEFAREGKKSVVLVNWQGHPMGPGDGQYDMYGPNYPGPLRRVLEEKYNCEVAFVLGGSGNMNNNSQIPGELDHSTYVELGTKLAEAAYDLLQNNMTVGVLDRIRLEENLFVTPDKIGVEVEVPLYAFSVGDWACVTTPFEIFDTNAKAVRDASKFPMTFYATCANDRMSYLPTPPSFDWEITYETQVTKFPKGMAEMVQEQLTQMLDRIFTAAGYAEQEKREGYLTPADVPATDGVTYTNPAYGMENGAVEVQNGFYALNLLEGGKLKKMLAIDKETADKVMAKQSLQVILNEQNVIVDVVS